MSKERSIRANAPKSAHADVHARRISTPRRWRPRSSSATSTPGRLNVVKSNQMPIERSPDGLIKHIINERMDTKECCLDIYMQFIPAGKATGKHRHLSEEVFYVIEGTGYDLHWDVRFDCKDEYGVGVGRRAEALRMEPGRLRLHPALLHPPALQRRSERTKRASSSSTAAS